MKTHDFGATYQEGIISAVDAANHKVRCKIPALEDLETAWLSYLTPNAGGNQGKVAAYWGQFTTRKTPRRRMITTCG